MNWVKCVIKLSKTDRIWSIMMSRGKPPRNFSRYVWLCDNDFGLTFQQANPFKLEIIDNTPESEPITVYKGGPFLDIDKGPHIPNTNLVRAIKATKVSGVYWQGDPNKPLLQRIYGVCFPEKKLLYDWEDFQSESAKRNHREVGKVW